MRGTLSISAMLRWLLVAVAIFALLHPALTVRADDEAIVQQQHDADEVEYVQAQLIDDFSAMEVQSEVTPKKSAPVVAKKPSASGKASSASTATTADADDFSEKGMRAKFEEFKKKKRKPYKSSATEAAGYERFKKNRLHVKDLNSRMGGKQNSKVFTSTGKFADMTPAEFAAKYLSQKVPVGQSHGKPVASAGVKTPAPGSAKKTVTAATSRPRSRTLSPQTAGPKAKGKASPKLKRRSRQLSLEPSSMLETEQQPAQPVQPPQPDPSAPTHQAGGLSGDTGGKSGKTGGLSGGVGKKSGKTGGDSGGIGQKSGKTGGDSGGIGQKSGKTGGDSGGIGKKSGKTGGDSGSTGKKSGKTGGVTGDTGSKSGKTGGDPTANPGLPSAPTGNISYTAVGTHGILTPDQLRAQLQKYGVADADITFAMTPRTDITSPDNDPAGDQAVDCGSCWAHSTIKLLNSMNAAAHWRNLKPGDVLTMPKYSVQYLLDCVTGKQTKGCGGGTPMNALDWLAKNPIATEAEYPLRTDGMTGTCAPPSSVASNPILSWGWSMAIPECPSKGDCTQQVAKEVDLLKWMASGTNTNVMAVAYVDATNWQNYQAGFFPPEYCSNTMEAGNHLVFIQSLKWESGIPYWLISNSWGDDWGRFGHIWLPAFTNACGLANFVIIPNQPPPDKANVLGWMK